MYLQIKTKSHGSKSSNANTTDKNEYDAEADDYLDTLNLDVKVKEVEKQFFRKKSRVSDKFISKALTFLFLLFHLIFYFMVYVGKLKDKDDCVKITYSLPMVLLSFIVYLIVLLLLILTFLIRNIKDNHKIKNEINMTIIFIILIIFFLYFPMMSEKINYHPRWPALIYTPIQYLIIYAYPIYWAKQFEKNKNKINKDDDDVNNNDENSKSKNNSTFSKFLNIIEDPEKVNYWMIYSKKSYSVENILFYRTCKSFQSFNNNTNKKKKKKLKMMKSILNNFILEKSPLAINISSNVRKEIIKNYKEDEAISNDIFDDALKEIINLMFTDTWPQFLDSNIYVEMVMKVEQINPGKYLNDQDSNKDEDLLIKQNKIDDDDDDESDINMTNLNSKSKSNSKNSISSEKQDILNNFSDSSN
ncbi:regulator of g protein signaling [Anaeramoeba flamelloides]|uniref:Regulator of g protein signaling n=1 Tax=Anaeramoeba flamelloides TaxID=1746091 RepID=A0ABQ8YKW1_9EUKA|nr:regulator of g protein signaling [Anaeramoeba flamelloides]